MNRSGQSGALVIPIRRVTATASQGSPRRTATGDPLIGSPSSARVMASA